MKGYVTSKRCFARVVQALHGCAATTEAVRPTIPNLSRSSLHRCLQRHDISPPPDVEPENPDSEPEPPQASECSSIRGGRESAMVLSFSQEEDRRGRPGLGRSGRKKRPSLRSGVFSRLIHIGDGVCWVRDERGKSAFFVLAFFHQYSHFVPKQASFCKRKVLGFYRNAGTRGRDRR